MPEKSGIAVCAAPPAPGPDATFCPKAGAAAKAATASHKRKSRRRAMIASLSGGSTIANFARGRAADIGEPRHRRYPGPAMHRSARRPSRGQPMSQIKLLALNIAAQVVRLAMTALLLIAGGAGAAGAQTIEQFYKGRQVTLIVFSGPGSTYDVYARLLARHLGDHIPGKPTFVVQNLLGAGGLKTIDYLNKIAPRDGSVIGTVGRGLPFEPMLGKNEVRFDPLAFTWLGSMNRETTLAMSWHTSKVRTFADLKQHELLVPGTGAGADSEIIPLAINNLAGTRFKIIGGYRDTSEGALAMERGELEGLAYWSWSAIMAAHPDWLRDHK